MREIKDLTLRQQENIRHKIAARSSGYVKLLDRDARGEISLTQGRRASIQIMLRKVVPDLTATEVTDTTTKQVNPQQLTQELMQLLANNPDVARKVAAIVNKKPELRAVDEA